MMSIPKYTNLFKPILDISSDEKVQQKSALTALIAKKFSLLVQRHESDNGYLFSD